MNTRESRDNRGRSESRDRDFGDRGGDSRDRIDAPQGKLVIDYKDLKTLKRFLSEDGKILPRRRSGLSAKNQRAITTAIKRARHLAMLPYSTRD